MCTGVCTGVWMRVCEKVLLTAVAAVLWMLLVFFVSKILLAFNFSPTLGVLSGFTLTVNGYIVVLAVRQIIRHR
ncbi:MAG: hypothetical protein Greene041679_257 [Parcubacteria group bacterium Greene0416_79]|nr:MAG: hypothetical protein Greene041679_257 [Parcubacteria group bacterium Greene0416_79]